MRSLRLFSALLLLLGTGAGIRYAVLSLSAQITSGTGGKALQGSVGTLPKDVYPDSRNRLPLITRQDLDDAGKKIYDETAGDARLLAGLQGPGGIRLYSPRLAEHMRGGTNYLRFDTPLGRRLTELATLITARELDQQFEWNAHESAAVKAGLEQEIIDVVKYSKPLTGLGEKETVIIQLGREVFGKRKVSSDTFAHAHKLFGNTELVDLASVMGQFSATAVLLSIFDQQLPLGKEPPLAAR